MGIVPETIVQRIIEHLHAMDREANTTTAKGTPTGLNWYGGHVRSDLQRPQTEPNWSKRLAELLNTDGIQAAAEMGYPDKPRTKCDLVVTNDNESFWIEIKGAWKEYCHQTGTTGNYISYPPTPC